MKSFGVTSVLLLALVLASPSAGEAQVLPPSELCSDSPASAIASFEDANLEARVRAALYLGEHDDLTCRWVSGLTGLGARSLGSTSLVGIQNLTSLTFLDVYRNSISDIGALSGLTSLRLLHFGYNSITDISPLSGLTSLRFLHLDNNPDLTDIQPLLDNTGLGEGDTVDLTGTNVSCTDVRATSQGSDRRLPLLVTRERQPFRSMGFVSIIIVSVLFALGLPLVLL